MDVGTERNLIIYLARNSEYKNTRGLMICWK